MKSNKFYISILILFLSVFSVFGQTRKQLEAQRKKLNKEIKQVNTLLFNEIKKEKNAVDALKDIFQKIDAFKFIISKNNQEYQNLPDFIENIKQPIYLQPIGWISPLWHATELGRYFTYGHSISGLMIGVHFIFLTSLLALGLKLAFRNFTKRLSK